MATDLVAQALAGNIELSKNFGSAFETGMKIAQASETAKMENNIAQQRLNLDKQKLVQDVNDKTFTGLKFVTDPNTPADLKVQAFDELNKTRMSVGLPGYSDAVKNGIIKDKENYPTFQKLALVSRAVNDPNNPASNDPGMIAEKQNLERLLSTAGYSDLPGVIESVKKYNETYDKLISSATAQQGLGDKDLLARANAARSRFAAAQTQLTSPEHASSITPKEMERLQALGDRFNQAASGPPTIASVSAQEAILVERDKIIQGASQRVIPAKSLIEDIKKARENLSQVQGVGGMGSQRSIIESKLGNIQSVIEANPGIDRPTLDSLRNKYTQTMQQAQAFKDIANNQATKQQLEIDLPKLVKPIVDDARDFIPLKRDVAKLNEVLKGNGTFTTMELNALSYNLIKAVNGARISDADVRVLGIGTNLDEAKKWIASTFGKANSTPSMATIKQAKLMAEKALGNAQAGLASSLGSVLDNGGNYDTPAARDFFTKGAGYKTMRNIVKKELKDTDFDTAYSTEPELMAKIKATNPSIKDPRILRQTAVDLKNQARQRIGQ